MVNLYSLEVVLVMEIRNDEQMLDTRACSWRFQNPIENFNHPPKKELQHTNKNTIHVQKARNGKNRVLMARFQTGGGIESVLSAIGL